MHAFLRKKLLDGPQNLALNQSTVTRESLVLYSFIQVVWFNYITSEPTDRQPNKFCSQK